MKKTWVVPVLLTLALAGVGYALAVEEHHTRTPGTRAPQMTAQMMPGQMGPQMMGQMGQGMMGMMGRGMMEECARMMQGAFAAAATPITKEQAEATVKQYLTNLRNPNLKLGTIKEEEAGFIVEILTKENSLVDKLLVDKRTGSFRSIY